ncbi:TPA: hypothetical protein R1765_001934 [Campylobacter coli]|nr:hypothetical protein [Campylobacter coli]
MTKFMSKIDSDYSYLSQVELQISKNTKFSKQEKDKLDDFIESINKYITKNYKDSHTEVDEKLVERAIKLREKAKKKNLY